jgi:hypothetical protein
MTGPSRAFAVLRAFARPRAAREERCDLCAARLAPEHDHLLDRERVIVRCACDACAILFERGTGARWRRVPRVAERLAGFRLDDVRWDALGIPIGLAFIARRDGGAAVARYPSPGGAIEAGIPAGAWEAIVVENPALADLAPEVEALLVRRLRGPGAAPLEGGCEAYRVSIDVCYRLVGLVRRHWRGFSGGDGLWSAVGAFFDGLDVRRGGSCA